MLRSLWIWQRWIAASEPNTVVMAENKAFASSMTNCSRCGRRAAGRRHASDGFACTSRRSRGFQPGQGTRPAPAAQHPRFPQSGLTIRGKRLVRALGRRRQAVKQRIAAFEPSFNRCVLFATGDESFHGVTEVRCPPNESRRSFAAYYYPDPAPDRGPREACPSWRTGRSCIPVRKRSLQ
jgi:hypothetical protein